MSSALRTVLSDFTRIEGVSGVALISKDGFPIEYIMPRGDVDPEALAAMVVTLIGAATRISEELRFGDLDIVTAEYRNNYLLMEDVGPAFFVVIADRRAVLGRIRFEMKRQRDRIRAALGPSA